MLSQEDLVRTACLPESHQVAEASSWALSSSGEEAKELLTPVSGEPREEGGLKQREPSTVLNASQALVSRAQDRPGAPRQQHSGQEVPSCCARMAEASPGHLDRRVCPPSAAVTAAVSATETGRSQKAYHQCR